MSVSEGSVRGAYFSRTTYQGGPLPDWVQLRQKLPRPLWPLDPALEDTYWLAWETAVANLRRPAAGQALVVNYLDSCVEGRLRLADTAWATMFTNLAHGLVPGVEMLDNFYHAQHPDGEICQDLEPNGEDHGPWVNREGRPLFSRRSGRAVPLGREAPVPALTLDGLNQPLAAWAERESYRQTGDASRVAEVWEPLWHQHRSMGELLRHASGLIVADWAAMENSPRNPGLCCGVDASSQHVLSARCLAELAPVAARQAEAAGQGRRGLELRQQGLELAREADELSERIRALMWDEQAGWFFDLRADGTRLPVPTIAAAWTLVAGVASPEQAARLANWLEDPRGLGTPAGPATLATAWEGFDHRGGFYRGAVWPTLVLMVLRGLRRYGYGDLAHRLALGHLGALARVMARTGQIWENYAPSGDAPGRPARPAFVGQSGVGPITILLEFVLGLWANAPLRQLTWEVRTQAFGGCERYRLGGTRVQIQAPSRPSLADPLCVTVESDQPIQLLLSTGGRQATFRVTGRQEVVL